MKKFYITFFLISEMFLLFSCSGRTQVIDFKYVGPNSVPTMEVIIGGTEVDCVFDTGAVGNTLLPPGIRKLYGDKFIEKYLSNKPENAILIGKIRNIHIGENFYFRRKFEMDIDMPADIEKEFDWQDGVLGYKFFHNANNILIDYENKKIEVNTKKTLARNNVIDFYTDNDLIIFPFYVNGSEKKALLDTDFDTMNELKVATPEIAEDGLDSLNIRIGNIEYADVEARYYKESTYAAHGDIDSLFNFLQNYYIIGNAFFSDGKIEIDFKNKQLIIVK